VAGSWSCGYKSTALPLVQLLSLPSDFTPITSLSHDLQLPTISSMAATQAYKFLGWLGYDSNSVNGNLVEAEFTPKPFEETDVDIKITHCGMCGK
jgi:hypothetical protein